jgi:hypothetical protein
MNADKALYFELRINCSILTALSENLTERPLLRNSLHPLDREEPTLVTAIRLGRG